MLQQAKKKPYEIFEKVVDFFQKIVTKIQQGAATPLPLRGGEWLRVVYPILVLMTGF